jgi:S-methylmethionine-dependent homocysteine/selenocysteine methylase
MLKLKRMGVLLLALVSPVAVFAGHHEQGEGIQPAASGGQVIVAYRVPCVAPAAGVAVLKELIAYESSVAAVNYSSVATVLDDETVGAIDVHASTEAMQRAFAWQEQDEQWLAIQMRALGTCEAGISDIETSIHRAQ